MPHRRRAEPAHRRRSPRGTASGWGWPRPSSTIPQVLILDEPTIGLDPKQITEIRALIKSLAGSHTVILSTHILPEVSMVCGARDHHQQGRHRGPGAHRRPRGAVLPARPACRCRSAGPRRPVRDGLARHPGRPRRGRGHRAMAAGRTWSRRRPGATCAPRSSAWPPQRTWELRELRRVGTTLEEVFMRIVAGRGGGAVDGARRPARGGGGGMKVWADLQEGDAALLHLAHRVRGHRRLPDPGRILLLRHLRLLHPGLAPDGHESRRWGGTSTSPTASCARSSRT